MSVRLAVFISAPGELGDIPAQGRRQHSFEGADFELAVSLLAQQHTDTLQKGHPHPPWHLWQTEYVD